TIFETELLDYLRDEGKLPEKPLIITFDDGYLDNYHHAYPALQDYDMKATIYAIVHYRGQKPGWNEHFDWHHAKEMINSGHVLVQSHSYKSHHLIPDTRTGYLRGRLTDEDGRMETTEQYEARVKEYFIRSKRLIEQNTGQPVISFAYAFGQYTDETEKWLEEAGYEMSFSIRKELYKLGDSPWAIPRITVNGEWSGEELIEEINALK